MILYSLSKLCTAAAIMVALVVAAPSLGAALRTDAAPFKYVALGDSFSAGEGVDPYFRDGFDPKTGRQGVIDNRCHRSSRAYATWVKRPADAKTLYAVASGGGKPGSFGGTNKYGSDANVRTSGDVTWASWACSGAITKNVLPKSVGGVPQTAKGQRYDRQTQLDGADLAGANLVTLTVGGNDVGFVEVLEFCAKHSCNTAKFKQQRVKIIDDTKPLLEKVYKEVAKRAPGARILVLGYPQLFPATEAEQSCKELSMFLGEQDMLRELGTRLNATIEAAVKAVKRAGAKIEYVSVAGRFAGHEVCGSKGAWVNGADTTPKKSRGFLDDESFHPTLDGQQDGYATAVNAALKIKLGLGRAGSSGSVAFTRRPGKFSQVYVLDMGRGSVQQITRDSEDHYDPGWSADGRRLTFSSRGEDRGGFYPSSIVIVDVVAGQRFVPLFDPRSSSGDLAHVLLSPAISPDGRRLCFTDQGWNIAVAPSDRRSETWKALALGVDCSWSPDGGWIAFTRLIVGPSREEEGVYLTSLGIWRMRPDGSNLRRVTSGSDWGPDWSPDGKRIAFSRRTRSGGKVRWNVIVASATGRGDRRLASGSAPTWSPDGRRIAFERFRYEGNAYEGTDIYVMPADGSAQRQLLRDAFAPDWGLKAKPKGSGDANILGFWLTPGGPILAQPCPTG